MSTNTLFDHVETAVKAIAENVELLALAEASFNAPLLVCAGSWFGSDRELGFNHAPFVSVIPGDDDAELELFRDDIPQPRTFTLRVVTGVPMTLDPVPPLPTAAQRLEAVTYTAGHGDTGERFHLAVVKTLTEIFRNYGTHAIAATCAYSGSTRFPLELFDSTIALEAPRTVATGAY